MLRVAHATDIHWFVPPPWRRLAGKRLLGTANLYLRDRRKHFDAAVQDALVQHIVELAPDLVVITGDLTAQALQDEFVLARERMAPILDRFPTFVQAGNHDVYTRGSAREGRLARTFGPWLHVTPGDPVARLDVDGVTVLGLDPCRPHVTASGRIPQDQLDRLAQVLDDPALDERVVLLALHYPVLDKHGNPYDGANHGLRNARDLLALLSAARNKPAAILHGHRHHGYRVAVDLGGVQIPSFNPGSSGYAHLADHDRAACMNLYEVHEDGTIGVERFRHDGRGFTPEAGGAYATGR